MSITGKILLSSLASSIEFQHRESSIGHRDNQSNAQGGRKNVLRKWSKNRTFWFIFAQKAHIFTHFLSFFAHFCSFFTTFFLLISPKPYKPTSQPPFLPQKSTSPRKKLQKTPNFPKIWIFSVLNSTNLDCQFTAMPNPFRSPSLPGSF